MQQQKWSGTFESDATFQKSKKGKENNSSKPMLSNRLTKCATNVATEPTLSPQVNMAFKISCKRLSYYTGFQCKNQCLKIMEHF